MKKSFVLLLICLLLTSCTAKQGSLVSSSTYADETVISAVNAHSDTMSAADNNIYENETPQPESDDTAAAPKSAQSGKVKTDAETKPADKPAEAEPAAAPETEEKSAKTPISSVADGETVYANETGKKFHSNPDCSNMSSPISMTRAEAEQSGRTYCKKCYE